MTTFECYTIIKNFENYAISNFGKIINIAKQTTMKQPLDKNGYPIISLRDHNGKSCNLKVHRLVALHFLTNPLNKRCVDHIDGDKANNHIDNLRFATFQENAINRKIHVNNKTGYKGIRINKSKFIAYITVNKKYHHLGSFDNIEDALQARFQKLDSLFGEFVHSSERIKQ